MMAVIIYNDGFRIRTITYVRQNETRWSWLLVPTFDMGSDVATAVTHYKWGNYG